ncbi:hypothetical protein [Lactobacillus mulieris]|uniref:Yip1 domain-containing protein n=1 Tax=Lactobacillus mulieris TaxID=2508708 RepID=A0AAW5WXN8_9LACO|nr:hypothetical protein [Lactobacillus mulieris]MCZ3621619.1 hypothetical protein [Lactobacillus mulieris]MCZ3623105.1 hypothetical protein [Lactobacillus mulieris]MCZ3635626.1 hypothetical protein [Lactobacillus mulieris]MCZ3689266.1 hypothetical protein [Lactobacillus mulieris]MCZ3695269.1 hypothetical protein [Lactobacillus mulieris]
MENQPKENTKEISNSFATWLKTSFTSPAQAVKGQVWFGIVTILVIELTSLLAKQTDYTALQYLAATSAYFNALYGILTSKVWMLGVTIFGVIARLVYISIIWFTHNFIYKSKQQVKLLDFINDYAHHIAISWVAVIIIVALSYSTAEWTSIATMILGFISIFINVMATFQMLYSSKEEAKHDSIFAGFLFLLLFAILIALTFAFASLIISAYINTVGISIY